MFQRKKLGSLVKGQCFKWKNLNSNIFLNIHLFFLMKNHVCISFKKEDDCQENYNFFYLCNLFKGFRDHFNIVLSFTNN